MMSLRIKISNDEEGRVTISGLHYREFRAILCAAALHHYADLSVAKTCQQEAGVAWHKDQLKLIDWFEKLMDRAIRPYLYAPQPMTKEARWKRVRERKADRLRFEEIWAEMVAKQKGV
jgi:hypothetical protein